MSSGTAPDPRLTRGAPNARGPSWGAAGRAPWHGGCPQPKEATSPAVARCFFVWGLGRVRNPREGEAEPLATRHPPHTPPQTNSSPPPKTSRSSPVKFAPENPGQLGENSKNLQQFFLAHWPWDRHKTFQGSLSLTLWDYETTNKQKRPSF